MSKRVHRRWSESENEIMRVCYGFIEVKHLATAFRRTIHSIHRQARCLRLTKNQARPFSEDERNTLRRMNAEGATDRAIALQLGRHEGVVLRERYKLDLSGNGQGEMARKNREVITKKRSEDRKSLARQYNLPEDLRARQVMILVLLAHTGMLTRHQIAERLGISPGSMSCRHLPPLRQKGLINYIKPALGQGQRGQYLLSPLAMELLSKAGREVSNDCDGEVHGSRTSGNHRQSTEAG